MKMKLYLFWKQEAAKPSPPVGMKIHLLKIERVMESTIQGSASNKIIQRASNGIGGSIYQWKKEQFFLSDKNASSW